MKSERFLDKRLAGPGLLLLLAGLALLALLLWPASGRSPVDPVVVRVKRAPLTINVLASGTIKARDQVVISNSLEGRTTILSLVAEGTQVRAGELLIELDASSLQDRRIDQQIVVQNAEAAFVQARENLEVVKNQARSDVEQARLARRFARDDLAKYQQGEYPAQQQEALARIALAEEELRRAEEKRSWSQVLFDERFLSQTELQADELAAQKARIDLELSRGRLTLLRDFDHPRRLLELKAEVDKTAMALERTERKAAADVVQAEAELLARTTTLERERGKLDKISQEIAKTRVLAPQDGMVIYATSTQASWRGAVEPLAAGQEVRERQELIYLPASGARLVETKIHESDLQQVQVGQRALVRLDALPGQIFAGRVESIAVLPDATSAWLNPDLKLYNTEILLEAESHALRSGMNCQVEILIDQIDKALVLPLQAVLVQEGQALAYQPGTPPRPVPVRLGRHNAYQVEIVDGLEAGAAVLLNPPLQAGGAL
ncbi:efflux RND transporter periplasmic adaptor subunit [Desulfuromonas thiophila]|uniref:HlyD family secretion protein n=1 Tax=Desulfuromonas thiophila TaxID=57664 RepID=A0A1G7A6V7_9BACT|nr:efflux RND transporter periplasmic adaptor subunit [Desulfuromonas thiophila]SDE09606.1 HlyD family secretion protein [Desulfuromonas thiophila]